MRSRLPSLVTYARSDFTVKFVMNQLLRHHSAVLARAKSLESKCLALRKKLVEIETLCRLCTQAGETHRKEKPLQNKEITLKLFTHMQNYSLKLSVELDPLLMKKVKQ